MVLEGFPPVWWRRVRCCQDLCGAADPPGLGDYRRRGRFDTFKSSQSPNPFSADGIYYIQILLQPRGETTFTGGTAEERCGAGRGVWVRPARLLAAAP